MIALGSNFWIIISMMAECHNAIQNELFYFDFHV